MPPDQILYFQSTAFYDMIRIMKMKIVTFSSLICLCGAIPAMASECTGAGCYIEPLYIDQIQEPAVLPAPMAAVPSYAGPTEYIYATQIPMRSVKTLSIKPVPADTRAPLWDGTTGKYTARAADKTVDWRDGVPIWDDSIVNYKSKDFSDWFLEPLPEIYLREADTRPIAPAVMTEDINITELYNQNMADAAATRARVEELLSPKRPSGNIWAENVSVTETPPAPEAVAVPAPRPEYTAQDMTVIVEQTFGRADGCPFEAETECEIWRRKPIIRETVSPRSPKIRDINMAEFINAARCNPEISASHPAAAPLLQRYKMLMGSANACCTDGMAYSLRQAGASDGLVYKFLADDANFYGLGARCLMMTDKDFDTKYPNTATAAVAADVRNGCLCRGRQWFSAMLAPFAEVYKQMPEFARQKFYYTYTDGLQREITVSVNNDVQNVLNQLEMCP